MINMSRISLLDDTMYITHIITAMHTAGQCNNCNFKSNDHTMALTAMDTAGQCNNRNFKSNDHKMALKGN